MAEVEIVMRKKDVAVLWGIDPAGVSRALQDMPTISYRADGLNLRIALQYRPCIVSRQVFDRTLMSAYAILDGKGMDPVAAAKDQCLYELYSADPPRRPNHTEGETHMASKPKPKAPPAAPVAALAPAPAVIDVARTTGDRAEQMAGLRMTKLQAEIDARNQRTSREAGELVLRAKVVHDMKSAGAIVQSTLGLLPGRLAALVPLAERPEVIRQAESAVERAIYAIIHALGDQP